MPSKLLTVSVAIFLMLSPLVRAEMPIATIPAETADLASMKWQKRPIIIFADTPADPALTEQMSNLAQVFPALTERDVDIIVDTNPNAMTEIRRLLRPVGFAIILIDKDGNIVMRKPSPRSGREIISTIDRLPLRRDEQRRQGGGRATGS